MSVKYIHKALSGMPNYLLVLTIVCLGLLLISCNERASEFALPEGDIEIGKVVYKKYSCYECHSISKIEWKGGSDSLKIPLGGNVSTQKSYGDLVTSVINPSHKIAPRYKQMIAVEGDLSKMKNYNEVMSVQELIDLVAFLQSEYKITAPQTDYYPYLY
ncbi:MAG: c-type cytochrome [Flavobacteriaceae bacterium]|nr:c-type cytochrome [Flavobacteriaceae bacterium]